MSGSSAARLASLALVLLVGACDLLGEKSQRGQVLDQDTGEPIAGAIVVGRYMGGGSWAGSGCNRAESSVSDAQGWFELPVDRDAGPVLKEAYKRGFDRGNIPRKAFLDNYWTREWRVAVQTWDETNRKSTLVRIEPEVYRFESTAKTASGEVANVYVRRTNGNREDRVMSLRLFQVDCAGPPRSTAGLVPFIEAILREQEELQDVPAALDSSGYFLESAKRKARSPVR
jgi:hypothetical protein